MSKIDEYSVDELVDELIRRSSGLNEQNSNLTKSELEHLHELRKKLSRLHYPVGEVTFKTNDYEGSQIDPDILNRIDKENNCCSLILGNPTTIMSCFRIDGLKKISIYNAKILLQTSVLNKDRKMLENGLTSILPSYGNKDAIKFKNAINFYEEQVLRQATETNNFDQNLFLLNRDAKRQIVIDNYGLFVDYFIDNAKEYVWGDFSSNSRKLLDYSKRNSTYQYLRIRSNFIRMISDYTTLSELEKEPIKTLDRFIIKK